MSNKNLFETILSSTVHDMKNSLSQVLAQLDELSAPFSDDVAYYAFLEMERTAAGLGG